MRRVLFHRQYLGYSGGHGKMRDYATHVDAHPGFEAWTWLTPDSDTRDNPWIEGGFRLAPDWRPEETGLLFLGGLDWQAVPSDLPGRPVINLVQHVRHADPADPRRAFLRRPAVRICVSQPVADAILATGEVNGPVHVVPAALELPAQPPRRPGGGTRPRIAIAGGKAPELARAVADALAGDGLPTDLLPAGLPRAGFLARLAAADIAVLLPHEREGFYLPGLEAMSLGCAVVMPDAGGNREYARPGVNALQPPREAAAIAAAVRALLPEPARRGLASAGQATAAGYTLARERAAFHSLLDRLDQEWATCRHAC